MPLSHARASLGFCTFCFHNLHRKGPKKRWSFLEKRPTFFFFSPMFSEKCRTFLWASSHVFESWLQFEDNGLLWKSLFPFSLSKKNASFQHSCVKVVKAKKCKSLGTRPRITCAREKPLFFEQNMTLIMSVSSRRNSPDFYIPFSRILAPKWEDSLQLNEEDGIPIKILWFRPVSLRRNCIVGLCCKVWFAKWSVAVDKTSLFRRFFSLCSHIDPYINRGNERDEGKKSNIMKRYNPQSVIWSL